MFPFPRKSLVPISSQALQLSHFLTSIIVDWFCVFLDFKKAESFACWFLLLN